MSLLNHRWIQALLFATCIYSSSLLYSTPSKLESNSPFLPPGYSNQKPVVPKTVELPSSPLNRDLEFRGIVQLDGTYQFSLFKKSENRGYWIAENSSENGISVSNFDPDSMQITVYSDERTEQLTLVTASENPLPVIAASNSAPATRTPAELPSIQPPNTTKNASTTRRTIPRRRVIVPPKR